MVKGKSFFLKHIFSGEPLAFKSIISAFFLGLFGLGISLFLLMVELIASRLWRVTNSNNGIKDTKYAWFSGGRLTDSEPH